MGRCLGYFQNDVTQLGRGCTRFCHAGCTGLSKTGGGGQIQVKSA